MAFLDTVREQLKPDDPKAREQLDILKKAATGELNEFRGNFLARFQNPDGFKQEILPKKMLGHFEEYRVDLDEKASDQISGIIDNFFQGTEGSVKAGFANIIKFAFTSILGSTQAGESKTQNWYITLEYGALIRVDVMAWRYNFSADGVIATIKNAFCYTVTKSFVDGSSLDDQQLTYFVAQSLGLKNILEIQKNETIQEYIKFLKRGRKNSRSLNEVEELEF